MLPEPVPRVGVWLAVLRDGVWRVLFDYAVPLLSFRSAEALKLNFQIGPVLLHFGDSFKGEDKQSDPVLL